MARRIGPNPAGDRLRDDEVAGLHSELARVREERDELQACADLQADYPELRWPDQAKLFSWVADDRDEMTQERDTLRAEVERLRGALEFYAERSKWRAPLVFAGVSEIANDNGRTARDALEAKDTPPDSPAGRQS